MKTERKLLLLAFMCGLTFWVIDARLDYALLPNNTFLGSLTYQAPAHKLNIRLVVMVLFLAFGQTAARLWAQRVAVEEQVKKERDCADRYLNTAGVLLASLDTEGRITVINREGCETLGYSKEELLGEDWFELVLPDKIQGKVRGVFHQILQGKVQTTEYYENPVVTRDGKERLLTFHNTILRDADGNVSGVLFSAEDITERKRTEKALTVRERAIEASINAIALADVDGRLTYVNPAFLNMWGYEDQAEVLGRHYEEFWDDPDSVRDVLSDLHDEGSRTTELCARRKDGTSFEAELSASIVEDSAGKPICMMSSCLDISERKRAEEALRESERKYRNIFNLSPEAIVLLDSSGYMIDVNGRLNDWLGYVPEEIEDRQLTELPFLPPESKKKAAKKFRDRMAGKEPEPYELDFVDKDGRRHIGFVRGTGLKDEYGDVVTDLIMISDITKRKKAEERLRSLNRELQRSNRDLQDFAYTVSHDLQEPLRMVSSYVQLLEKRYQSELDADADDFIGYAVAGTHRMRQLIHDLLAYSRVGTRGKPFRPTDCQNLLKQVLDDLKTTIDESDAVVTHDELPRIKADASQLEQVFQNLISNAIKYRHRDRTPRIDVSVDEGEDEWLFAVCDNGIGFQQEFSDRIFRIFQRLHGGSEYGGTGVGLAICKRVVERHGGKIWGESSPGKGSTFYFTIPKEPQAAADAGDAGETLETVAGASSEQASTPAHQARGLT